MIYLLEDDATIRNFTEYALKNAGFETASFEKPSLFWSAVKDNVPELLLLDVMLPEEDGFKILNKLKGNSATKDIPVIMLTAKGSDYDKVIGFDCGADDYVTKPFSIVELIARVKALLRRTSKRDEGEYSIGSLYVHPIKHIVKVEGNDITLTFKEFELLCLLISSTGKVFTREEILRRVWGFEFEKENRTIDVHIKSLRQKLGNAGELVETVRGVGYKIGG